MPKSRLRKKGRHNLAKLRRNDSDVKGGFKRFGEISPYNVMSIARKWLYRNIGKSGVAYLKKSWGKNFDKFAVMHWEAKQVPEINAKKYFKFTDVSILKNYFVNCNAGKYLVAPKDEKYLQEFMMSRRSWLTNNKKAA